jgi:hypothetical protein
MPVRQVIGLHDPPKDGSYKLPRLVRGLTEDSLRGCIYRGMGSMGTMGPIQRFPLKDRSNSRSLHSQKQ